MTSHAQRFLVVVVKIAPSIARSPGKCQKISRSEQKRHVGQGKQPGGFTKLCAGVLYKFKEIQRGVLHVLFFDGRRITGSVVKNISMEKIFFPNSGYRVRRRKIRLNIVPI